LIVARYIFFGIIYVENVTALHIVVKFPFLQWTRIFLVVGTRHYEPGQMKPLHKLTGRLFQVNIIIILPSTPRTGAWGGVVVKALRY
jgi:hypothetical protein